MPHQVRKTFYSRYTALFFVLLFTVVQSQTRAAVRWCSRDLLSAKTWTWNLLPLSSLPFANAESIAIRKTTTNTAHALRPATQIEVAAVLGTPAALLLEAINFHWFNAWFCRMLSDVCCLRHIAPERQGATSHCAGNVKRQFSELYRIMGCHVPSQNLVVLKCVPHMSLIFFSMCHD